MPPKEDKKGGKSKQIQAAKAAAKGGSSGGKAKKKKWSKGKTKEKLVNLVLFDKATYDKVVKELPTTKVITPAVVSERFKINGSLARRAIRDLAGKGLIKKVAHHHRQYIYTRATPADK